MGEVLKLHSKRRCIQVEVDEEVVDLPCSPTVDELKELTSSARDGSDVAEIGMEVWSRFARPYLGDVIDTCGYDELMAVMRAWLESSGLSMGESSDSQA